MKLVQDAAGLRQIVADRRILLVSGKGGIGKSLVSVMLGLEAAAAGKRVCIVEHRADDRIAPMLGHAAVGHKTTFVTENLAVMNLNSTDNFRDFIVKHLGYESLFERVFNTAIVKSFVKMLPGVADLTLLGRLYYMCELAPERFDLVIFDGYASGHFLNLLSTPAAILRSGLVGPVVKETQRVMDYFNSKDNTGIVIVTTPEPLVLSEVRDFLPKIVNTQLSRLSAIVVNKYTDEAELLKQTSTAIEDGDALHAAAAFARRRCAGSAERLTQFKHWLSEQKLDDCPLVLIPDQGFVPHPFTASDLSTFKAVVGN